MLYCTYMPLHHYIRQERLNQIARTQNVNAQFQKIFGSLFCLIVILVAYNAIVFINLHIKKQAAASIPTVAGVNTTTSTVGTGLKPVPTITIVPTSELPLTETPTPALSKNSYTIAIIGDSMVDTMGEKLEYLEHALDKKYPNVSFKLYNYGKGSENVVEGMKRFFEPFHYKDRNYPPITEINADIIMVASYGYNPLYPFDRDAHWLKLTEMIQSAQKYTKTVYILAEIAPLTKDFGKGTQGVNWEDDIRIQHAKKIQQQIENAIGLSRTLNVPLIDAYRPSTENGEGMKKYVNTFDGIHPSIEGHEFMAEKIVETLKIK